MSVSSASDTTTTAYTMARAVIADINIANLCMHTCTHCRPILLADPELQTSLRWLTTDSRNALHKAVLHCARRAGIMGRTEPFDPTTLKTKCIFMGTQFLFTVATMLPAALLYSSYTFHCIFLLLTFGCAVWNGSNFCKWLYTVLLLVTMVLLNECHLFFACVRLRR
jgi:hypothetical protein